jgi:hypothetical protein
MRRTRIAAISAVAALAAAGTGVAVATSRSDEAGQRENAVLSDAAKRLDVTPSELRDALGKAQDAQLDAEVKAGRLTQEQADAIKARRKAEGTVLGGGPWHHGGPGFGRGPGGPGRGPGEVVAAAAKALGLTEAELFEQFRAGRSLADIAKAQDKDVADVKAAVREAVEAELDAGVKDGRLTRAQADDMLERLTERLDDFGSLRFGGHHRGGPGDWDGPPEPPAAP